MKKMIAMLLACLMVLSLMACTARNDEDTIGSDGVSAEKPAAGQTQQPEENGTAPDEEPEDELETLPETETEIVPDEVPDEEPDAGTDSDASVLSLILDELLTDLDAEFLPYYSSYDVSREDAPYVTGYAELDTGFNFALGYGPMMGSIPYIMVLFELPEELNAEDYAAALRDNAVLNKWVCVSADYAHAYANGQYVLFLMSSLENCPISVRSEIADRFTQLDIDALTA